MTILEFRRAQEEFQAVVREALAYGPDPLLDQKFRHARACLQSKYPEMRQTFGELWTTASDPHRFHGQNTDPFESILAAPNLEGLLRRDARQIERDLADIRTAFELCCDTGAALV